MLKPGDAITVTAVTDARFMLFGGAPMEGPHYIWWNFVSSRLERIEAAKEEWACGRFDTVPGDEADFVLLPVKPDQPQRATGGVVHPYAPRPLPPEAVTLLIIARRERANGPTPLALRDCPFGEVGWTAV